MSMRTVELVSEWDAVPFDGGYDGLRSLSDQGFSGAVTAGPTQLFMLNGTVVGILEGDIEDFDGTDGTARTAPHDALPLLIVMQDRAEGPRAQYYTEDTAISEVDRTLEDGNFTGFVELSENVLSGDYYLVYHQGRSMSVAWVGNSKRLVTDEAAFEQADDEVGIYQVMPADIEPVEIPEPSAPSPAADDVGVATGSAPSDASQPSDAQSVADVADTEPASATAADVTEQERGTAGPPGSKAAGASQGTAVDRTQREEPDARSEATAATEAEPATTTPTESRATEQSEKPPTPAGGSQTAAATTDSDAVGELETRSIPSLDPERSSSTPEETARSAASSTAAQSADTASTQSQSTATASAQPAASEQRQPEPSPELEAKLEERVAEITELESEIRDLSAENEELAAERDRLVAELEEARAEIQRLEAELAAAGEAAPSGETLSPAAAIDGTNLFIRYHSKGDATLEKAQNGGADRAAVEENLRLEHHTQFDAADTVVDGETFEAFLQNSIQYRFADWLVRNLLYEIRDTGHESAMGVLYEALPKADRAELNGNVSVTYTEDGQEHRSQETFDVVVRDRMGNPLAVANINDSRQPATEGQMTDIIQNAERVGNASDSLAAAFLVTSSFFEPEALETAREATSSGLFSRDKRKSFVNLSRKGGYHLCLLEARNKEFHLAVPEL
ncbi:hypothetical protein BRC96_03370 [Halobacteriales archaeon QS_6_64_34]|nr:MAG: hypothetical protein BRC96_03370 [Halobacteriales archaeon QS_6_64_34]